jgi:hypothetical protein
MIEFIGPQTSDRKIRLYACACWWRIAHLLRPELAHAALIAERYADRLATWDDREQAIQSVKKLRDPELAYWRQVAQREGAGPGGQVDRDYLITAAESLCSYWTGTYVETPNGTLDVLWAPGCILVALAGGNHAATDTDPAARQEAAAQAQILRDIVGSPFRPVAVDPAWMHWQDGTIGRLARATHASWTICAVVAITTAAAMCWICCSQSSRPQQAAVDRGARMAGGTYIYRCDRCPLVLEVGGYCSFDGDYAQSQVVCAACGTLHRLTQERGACQVTALPGPVRAMQTVTVREVGGEEVETWVVAAEADWRLVGGHPGGITALSRLECSHCRQIGRMVSNEKLFYPDGYTPGAARREDCPVCGQPMDCIGVTDSL